MKSRPILRVGLFEGGSKRQEFCFAEVWTSDLQADRQTGLSEAAGNRDRGPTEGIERPRIPQPKLTCR